MIASQEKFRTAPRRTPLQRLARAMCLVAPAVFEPEVEAIYRVRQNQRALPNARVALLTAPIIALSFIVWDFWLCPQEVGHTVPVRLAFSLFSLGLWGTSFWSSVRRRVNWLMVALAFGADLSLVFILNALPGAWLFGLTGFAFPQIASTVLPNARFTALIGALMLVVVNGAALAFGFPPNIVINSNFLLGFFCVLTYLSAYGNEVRARHLFQVELRLEGQATTDDLSGAFNRRHFLDCAEVELSRATRYGHPTPFLLLDIDHFKRINDTYGHHVGDDVICMMAELCRGTLRKIDTLGRVGGEEFAILLPETDLEVATQVAERLRENVVQRDFRSDEKLEPLSLTISVGVAYFQDGESIEALMKRADAALYEAKRSGRNRVVVG